MTVIMAVPGRLALIVPCESTETIFGLLVRHLSCLSVALFGVMLTFKCDEFLARINTLSSPKLTPVTLTIGEVTVTLILAVCPPSFVRTVIVAVPGLWAVTLPFELTVATVKLFELHVTF